MARGKKEDKKWSNGGRSGITFTIQGKEGIELEKKEDLEKKKEDIQIEVIDESETKIGGEFKEEGTKFNDENVRIELINVSKRFDRNYQKQQTALARLLSFFRGEHKQDYWALENISLKVRAGENLGIIGKNGSGKSTLLRVIAEVYNAEEGEVWTNGQLVYLTGFGHGLQPKLTMRENIFLVGSVMGLGQSDIKKRFNEIVEFSGLKDYIDTKLFKFSTGMQTRLASSIGLHCVAHRKPDILLVDEVIGGGADKDYQEKSLKKMEELLKSGSTVVLVSHNLDAIKKYCDRVIWLEDGRVKMDGNPKKVIQRYLNEDLNVFFHVPKTGGTTLTKHIKENYKKNQMIEAYIDENNFSNFKEIADFFEKMNEETKKRVKFVFGHHVSFKFSEYFNKNIRYIVMFREPSERLISLYNYHKMLYEKNGKILPPSVLSSANEVMSFENWLINNPYLNNFYIRSILGLEEEYKGEIGEKELEKAKMILDKFFFIGILGNKEDFDFIYGLFGISKFFKNQNISEKYALNSPSTIQLIKGKNSLDYQLYDYAKSINRKFKTRDNYFREIVKKIEKLREESDLQK